MAESKTMAKKEISFMKKKGAPASMIKHEKAEYGMKKGGIATSLKAHAAAPASKAHGMKSGGMAASKMGSVKTASGRDGIATKGKTKGTMIKNEQGRLRLLRSYHAHDTRSCKAIQAPSHTRIFG